MKCSLTGLDTGSCSAISRVPTIQCRPRVHRPGIPSPFHAAESETILT
jgi:hypothetical protein